MSGLEGFALGAAPLAGGALLGGMAGKGTDLRAVIKSELDLLERIPEDEVTRRSALEQVIAQHVNDLAVAEERGRQRQRRISYFTENWRDLVLFLTTVLFTVITWHADHHRPIWLPLFIAATLMSVVTALYCAAWLLEAHSPGPSRRPRPARPRPPSLVSTAGPTGPNGRGSTRSIGPTGSNIRSAGSNGRDWDRVVPLAS